MFPGRQIFLLLTAIATFLLNGCVSEFVPKATQDRNLLVVEGLITDRHETDTVKISKAIPIGSDQESSPVEGCAVSITDNLNNTFVLNYAGKGCYITDSSSFTGVPGRTYTLHVSLTDNGVTKNYESSPSEMKPVPTLDSLYYVRTTIRPESGINPRVDGCQIYISTQDPENKCNYYRWDFTETWIIVLRWPVDNNRCWITEQSRAINIKSTAAMTQSVIDKYPIYFVDNTTDRLLWQYSIKVNQYSLSEEEFTFWEKLKNTTEETGGLYDIIPSSIPGNIHCVGNPDEKVIGYFSVSAKSSKRIFIENYFSGTFDPYTHCVADTLPTDNPNAVPGMFTNFWPLYVQIGSFFHAPYTIITKDYGCYDCTVRGTKIKPDFWPDK